MEIRITQCQVGQFNMVSSEKTLSFHAAIYHEGQIVQIEGNIARISYSGTEQEYDDFKDALDNFDWVFEKCYKDGVKWIGSTDYRGETITFARVYTEHYAEINGNLRVARQARLESKIFELQRQLENVDDLPEYLYETANKCIQDEIDQYSKWMTQQQSELEQTKDGTEKYEKIKKYISNYQDKISKLTGLLISEPTTFTNGLT